MNILMSVVLVAQVLSAIGVIVLVLLQHGKGADMGAAFGSGSSGSLFGATGSANFLSRLTGGLATVFFISTLALSYLANQRSVAPKSIMEQPASTAPAPSGVPSLPGQPAAGGGSGVPSTGVPATGVPATGVPSTGTAPGAAPAAAPGAPAPAAPVPGAAVSPAAPGSAMGAGSDAAPQKSGQSGEIPK